MIILIIIIYFINHVYAVFRRYKIYETNFDFSSVIIKVASQILPINY